MHRRICAIPLCIILCIAVFSFPVLSAPSNDYSGSYPLTVSAKFSYASTSNMVGPHTIVLGSFNYGEQSIIQAFFRQAYSGGYGVYADKITASYNLTLPTSKRVYFCARTGAISANALDFSSLSPYYNSSESFSVTEYFDTPKIDYNVDINNGYTIMSTTTVSTSNISWGLTYLCFDNVPAGTYSIIDSSHIQQSYANYQRAYLNLCPGVFITTGTSVTDVVNDYINGNSSFSDTLSNLSTTLSNSISNATSDSEKQFQVALGQFELDRLVQASNDKSLSNITETMQPSLNNTIDNFVSGSSTLESALGSLASTFDTQLGLAETPEQAQTVAIMYQVALKKLELQAQIKAAQNLDDAISDDEMSEFQDYYESESTLIESFKIEQFKSQIALDTWMLQLPSDEAAEYKRFFDYILNESEFRFFIIVPMCCGLISLVLGTRIRLSGRRESPHD